MTADGRIPESKRLALAQQAVKHQLALIGPCLSHYLFVNAAIETCPGLNIED